MKVKIGQQGFTLVEMMVVVGILAILSAVTIPGIIASIPRYQLRAESRELMINFKKAKVEAAKRNRDVIVKFVDATAGVQNGSYQVFVNVDRDSAVPHTFNPPTDIEFVNRTMPASIRLASNFSNEQAGYKPNGLPIQAANQNTVLTTLDGSRTYTLTVSAAGDLKIQ